MYTVDASPRIRQGDILQNLKYQYVDNDLVTVLFPYTVVLSQDCDLDQDFIARNPKDGEQPHHDSYLDTVLVCPAFNADKFRTGQHLASLELVMEAKNKHQWKYIKSNRDPRYHYLEGVPEKGIPELVIDFKRYYVISRDYVYSNFETQFAASIQELYRELLSQRFAYYLSRVALPDENSIA